MKRKIPKARPEYNSKGERVYCLETCRKPDDGNFMIGCDGCDEWFHGKCVGKEAPEESDDDEEWNCEKCEKLLAEMEDGKVSSSPVKKVKVSEQKLKTEKIRRMARKAFEETFTTLFENIPKIGLTDEIDFKDPAGVAEKVENYLFAAYSTNDEPSAAYKAKYRSLQFNLKDLSNERLKKRICCTGEDHVTLEQLVSLSPEELGNETVVQEKAKAEREALKFLFKPGKDSGSVDSLSAEVSKTNEESDIVPPPSALSDSKNNSASNLSILESSAQAQSPSESGPGSSIQNSTSSVNPAIDYVAPKIAPTPKPKPMIPVPKAKTESIDDLLAKIEPKATFAATLKQPSVDKVKKIHDHEFPVLSKNQCVWNGEVKMQGEGSFESSAVQVLGPAVKSTIWKEVLPDQMTITGRIASYSAVKYLNERLDKKSDIVVVELVPSLPDLAGFRTLIQYFNQKDRFAVVQVKNPKAVKDIYLCPVPANQSLLSIFSDLEMYETPLADQSGRDRFFAFVVIATGYLAKHKDLVDLPKSQPVQYAPPMPPLPTIPPYIAPFQNNGGYIPQPPQTYVPPQKSLFEGLGIQSNYNPNPSINVLGNQGINSGMVMLQDLLKNIKK